jgi:hypothetical protein
MEKKVSLVTYFLPSPESVVAQLFFPDMQVFAVYLDTLQFFRRSGQISLDIAHKQIKMRIRRPLASFPRGSASSPVS